MRILTAVLFAAPVLFAGTARSADVPRVGVLVVGTDSEDLEARAGLLAGLRLSGTAEAMVRSVGEGAAEAEAALSEMRHEGVRLVVAVGRAAASRAHATVRDRPVVFAGVDDVAVADLRRGGNACVATGVPPAEVLGELRRAAPGLGSVGVVAPPGDEVAAAVARELGGRVRVVVAPGDAATPDERAAAAASAFLPGVHAVWLAPSTSSEDADALARAFADRGVPLVGTRRRHLDAGCALVFRDEPRDVGALAAVLVGRVLADEDPGKLPVRRTSRRLVDVNLAAAHRLSFHVPLTLLARADEILRPRGVPR